MKDYHTSLCIMPAYHDLTNMNGKWEWENGGEMRREEKLIRGKWVGTEYEIGRCISQGGNVK